MESVNTEMTYNQYVLFKLEHELYGIDIHQVATIERIMPMTRVPHAADYVEGVINLRGEVVPVINLRKRLNLQQAEVDEETRIIIVSVEDMVVGLLVDSSSEVLQLSSTEVESIANISENIEDDYAMTIGKKDDHIIILLDINKVLGITE
jgi:purine-binding chemotaxis protein CheW